MYIRCKIWMFAFFLSISGFIDSFLVVGISVTLAFLVTVVISCLVVALAVARRRRKHVPQLPATEQIYDDIPMCARIPATKQIYDDIPMCAQIPATEEIYDIPTCETKLYTMNETKESGSNEIPMCVAMF